HQRAERAVVLPGLAATAVQVQVGVQERAQRALDRGLAATGLLVGVERLHPCAAGDAGAARDHRVEQRLLVLEVVVDQGVVHANALGHVLERYPVQAVAREQVLGGIEDLFGHLRALRGLGVALARPRLAAPAFARARPGPGSCGLL